MLTILIHLFESVVNGVIAAEQKLDKAREIVKLLFPEVEPQAPTSAQYTSTIGDTAETSAMKLLAKSTFTPMREMHGESYKLDSTRKVVIVGDSEHGLDWECKDICHWLEGTYKLKHDFLKTACIVYRQVFHPNSTNDAINQSTAFKAMCKFLSIVDNFSTSASISGTRHRNDIASLAAIIHTIRAAIAVLDRHGKLGTHHQKMVRLINDDPNFKIAAAGMHFFTSQYLSPQHGLNERLNGDEWMRSKQDTLAFISEAARTTDSQDIFGLGTFIFGLRPLCRNRFSDCYFHFPNQQVPLWCRCKIALLSAFEFLDGCIYDASVPCLTDSEGVPDLVHGSSTLFDQLWDPQHFTTNKDTNNLFSALSIDAVKRLLFEDVEIILRKCVKPRIKQKHGEFFNENRMKTSPETKRNISSNPINSNAIEGLAQQIQASTRKAPTASFMTRSTTAVQKKMKKHTAEIEREDKVVVLKHVNHDQRGHMERTTGGENGYMDRVVKVEVARDSNVEKSEAVKKKEREHLKQHDIYNISTFTSKFNSITDDDEKVEFCKTQLYSHRIKGYPQRRKYDIWDGEVFPRVAQKYWTYSKDDGTKLYDYPQKFQEETLLGFRWIAAHPLSHVFCC